MPRVLGVGVRVTGEDSGAPGARRVGSVLGEGLGGSGTSGGSLGTWEDGLEVAGSHPCCLSPVVTPSRGAPRASLFTTMHSSPGLVG